MFVRGCRWDNVHQDLNHERNEGESKEPAGKDSNDRIRTERAGGGYVGIHHEPATEGKSASSRVRRTHRFL